MNYLDVANAYLRHDWSSAVNSYWSPLYSWLLGAGFYIAQPSPGAESTALHCLNFFLFICAIFSGEFFIREIVNDRQEGTLPEWAVWCVGYSILLFACLFMNPAYLDTPDLCTSAFLYLAAGLLVRIRSGNAANSVYAVFGTVLAFAYFSKTVMFLVAFGFLLAAGIRRQTLLALACFLATAFPWIAILSHSVGRMTYGDAGTSNYIKYVDYSGSPIHPVRVLSAPPTVREFAAPIRATYPPWYNPPYWIEGLKPRFNVHKQLDVFVRSIRDYVHLLMGQKEYIVGFLIILATWPKFPRARWYLLAPVGLGFVLYALVHVESRLVGVFFVIFWMTLYSGLQVRSRPVVLAVTILVVSVTAFKIVRAQVSAPRNQGNIQWETAQTLQQNGIEAGSPVAVFGHQNNGDYWAHLGRFRVVADIQTEEMATYWAAPVHVRDNILLRLADELHVRAVVTPTKPLEKGWQPIPNSNYYVKFLETQRR